MESQYSEKEVRCFVQLIDLMIQTVPNFPSFKITQKKKKTQIFTEKMPFVHVEEIKMKILVLT